MHVHIYKVLKLKILKFFLKIKVWGVKTPAGNAILNQRQLPFLSYLTVNSKAPNQGHAPRPRTLHFILIFWTIYKLEFVLTIPTWWGLFKDNAGLPVATRPRTVLGSLLPVLRGAIGLETPYEPSLWPSPPGTSGVAEAQRRKHQNLSTSVSCFYCWCSGSSGTVFLAAADLELRVVRLRLAAGAEDWLGLLRRREGVVSALLSLEAGDSYINYFNVSYY